MNEIEGEEEKEEQEEQEEEEEEKEKEKEKEEEEEEKTLGRARCDSVKREMRRGRPVNEWKTSASLKVMDGWTSQSTGVSLSLCVSRSLSSRARSLSASLGDS